MRPLSVLLLSIALVAPTGCDKKAELTPEELAAKIAKSLVDADTRQTNNKAKDAEQLYTWILSQQPNHSGALRGMAEIRLAEKNYAEAEKLAGEAIAAGAADSSPHAVLGATFNNTERYAEAAGAWGKAYELEPTESRHGLKQGIAFRMAKKYAEAEKVLRAVAEDDPEVQFVYTELGDTLREQDRLDEALKLYMKAQTIFASDRRSHAGAAQVYEKQGNTTRAINEWSQYIRQDCCSNYSNETAKPRLEKLRLAEQGELAVDPAPAPAEGDQAG